MAGYFNLKKTGDLKTGTSSLFEQLYSPLSAGTQSVSNAGGTAGAWGDVITGIIDSGAMIAGNIRAYSTAAENYKTAQLNALSLFDTAEQNAVLMRQEADRMQATNLARTARSGLQIQAYDNLMLSDRIQSEKEIMTMKEEYQTEANSLLNTARRMKSRAKRQKNISSVLGAATIATAGIFGGSLGIGAAGTALKAGNALNQGITGSMGRGR